MAARASREPCAGNREPYCTFKATTSPLLRFR